MLTKQQKAPQATQKEGRWRIQAPAKLNLGLRVFPPRGDGFHDVETWMVPLSWHDILEYSPEQGIQAAEERKWAAELKIHGRTEGIPTVLDKNLVGRAMMMLAEKIGRPLTGRIDLHKVLPAGGGMGGGSSDAANTLLLLTTAWEAAVSTEELLVMAATLGSDVPFFVIGKPALCRGRGEIMTSLQPKHPLYAVLLLPEQGLATGPVFQAFDAGKRTDSKTHIPWDQWAGMPAPELNNVLINDLEPAAHHLAPWLAEIQTKAARAIGRKVHMTGSGSTLFTLCSSAPQAAETASVIAGVLPATATCVPVRILRHVENC